MRELSIVCDLGDISSDFNLEQKILGPKGKNLEFIEKKTGAIISLNWSTETLGRVDFKIAHTNLKDLSQAEKFVQSLIRSVKNEYMKYLENEYSQIKVKVDTEPVPATKPLMSGRQSVRCETCNMTISSQMLYELHLKSIGHLQNMNKSHSSQQSNPNRVYAGKLGNMNQSNQHQQFQGNLQHQQTSPQKLNAGGPSPLHGLYGNRNNQSSYNQGGNQQLRGGNQGYNLGNQGFNQGSNQGINQGITQSFSQGNDNLNQAKRDAISRTELKNFIIQQLNNKNAAFVFNMEKKMLIMIQQNLPNGKLTFQEPNGYRRLLIHRVAEYYHLSHEVSGEKMVIGYTKLARQRKEPPFKDLVPTAATETVQSPQQIFQNQRGNSGNSNAASAELTGEIAGIPIEEVAKAFFESKDQPFGVSTCKVCKIAVSKDQMKPHIFSVGHAYNLGQLISSQTTAQPVQTTCSRAKLKMRAVKAVILHHRDLVKLPKEAVFELKLDEPISQDRRGQSWQNQGQSGVPSLQENMSVPPPNVVPLMGSGPGMMARPSGMMGMIPPPPSMHNVVPMGMMMPPDPMQQAQMQQAQMQQAQMQQAQMQQAQMQQAQMQQAQMQQAQMQQQPPHSQGLDTANVAQKLAASVQEAISSGQSTGQLAQELQRNLLDQMGSAPSGEQKLLADTLLTLTELLKQPGAAQSNEQDRSRNDDWKNDSSNHGQDDRKRKGLNADDDGPRSKYSRDGERQFSRGGEDDTLRGTRRESRWSNADAGRSQREDDRKERDQSLDAADRWERGRDQKDWDRQDMDRDRRMRGLSRERSQTSEGRSERWSRSDDDRGQRGLDRKPESDRWARDERQGRGDSRERRSDLFEKLRDRSPVPRERLDSFMGMRDRPDLDEPEIDTERNRDRLDRQRRISLIEREDMIARLEALDRLEREEMYRRDPLLDRLPEDISDSRLKMDRLREREWDREPEDLYEERLREDRYMDRIRDIPYSAGRSADRYMDRLSPVRGAGDERRPANKFGGDKGDGDMPWMDEDRAQRDNRQRGGKAGEASNERPEIRRMEGTRMRDAAERRDGSPVGERRELGDPSQKMTDILEMLPLTQNQKQELLRVLPPNFTPELLADFHSMLIESLKMLVRKLQNPVTGPNGQPLRMSDLPPESREMIQQVQKMTGMQSLGNIGVTLNIVTALQEMDPNIVEVLGALDPEILNSLVSSIPGATDALAQLFTALRSMRGEGPEPFPTSPVGGGRGRGNPGMQQKGGRRGANQQRGGNRGGGNRGRGGRGRKQ